MAPTVATSTLYKFKPVTRPASKRLKRYPPATAPTIPRTISRNMPSPCLLTILLPRNPAINPRRIQLRIDMSIISGANRFEVCPPNPFDFGARWQFATIANKLSYFYRVLTRKPGQLLFKFAKRLGVRGPDLVQMICRPCEMGTHNPRRLLYMNSL